MTPAELRAARMTRGVFAEDAVHQGLPTFPGGFEIGNDLGAVAHRDEQLLVCGLGTATNRGQGNHGLELLGSERLSIGVASSGRSDGFVLFGRRYANDGAIRSFGHSV